MHYTIAVVEDETWLRKGLVTTTNWEDLQCRVIADFASPQEALETIPALKPDIVITDIRMPGISGLELIAKLRERCGCVFLVISGHDDFAYAQKAIEMGVLGYLLKPIDDAELEQAIRRAVQAVATKHRIQGLSRKAQAIEGAIRASAPYFTFERTAGKLPDRQIQKAVDHISTHFAEDLSAKTLAAILHCSESHLFKLFKAKTGYTVLEWITHYRMKEAITLMKTPSARIYEIAGKVGYKDVRYFSSVFKKHFGVTPTEYRNTE